MRYQELLFSASVLGAAIALNNCHPRNMRPGSHVFQSVTLPQSNYPLGRPIAGPERVAGAWRILGLSCVCRSAPAQGAPALLERSRELNRTHAAFSLLSISVARWKYPAAKLRSFSCVNASLIFLASNRHFSASDRRKIERFDMVAALGCRHLSSEGEATPVQNCSLRRPYSGGRKAPLSSFVTSGGCGG